MRNLLKITSLALITLFAVGGNAKALNDTGCPNELLPVRPSKPIPNLDMKARSKVGTSIEIVGRDGLYKYTCANIVDIHGQKMQIWQNTLVRYYPPCDNSQISLQNATVPTGVTKEGEDLKVPCNDGYQTFLPGNVPSDSVYMTCWGEDWINMGPDGANTCVKK